MDCKTETNTITLLLILLYTITSLLSIMIGYPGHDMDASAYFIFLFQFRITKYLTSKSYSLLSDVKKWLTLNVHFSIDYYIPGIRHYPQYSLWGFSFTIKSYCAVVSNYLISISSIASSGGSFNFAACAPDLCSASWYHVERSGELSRFSTALHATVPWLP